MSNITFGYPNRTDEATLSGGSWNASLPLANLKNRILAKVARTVDTLLASTKFDIDLGQSRFIGALALVVHNISVSGKVRLRGSNVADFSTTVYDSGWVNVWPVGMIPQDLLEWEDDNFWLGTLAAEARAGYQSPYIHLFTRVSARYWRPEIDDTGNSDGYIHIGRLFIADVWTPATNMSYGLSLGYEDHSQIEESLGGTEYFDTRKKSRITKLSLDWMDSVEAYSRLLEMQRMLGTSGELLIVPDPADSVNQVRRSYLGRLQRLGPLDHPQYNTYRTTLEVKELI